MIYTTIFIRNGGMYEKFRTAEGSYDSAELPAGNKTCPGAMYTVRCYQIGVSINQEKEGFLVRMDNYFNNESY